LDEALTDVTAMVGDALSEAQVRVALEAMLTSEGGELVYHGGTVLSGVAHWRPRAEG
jgi:hypothetical protein